MTTRFQSKSLGKSVEGRDLTAFANFSWECAPPTNLTLILGGVHGDEPAAYELVLRFMEEKDGRLDAPVIVWPLVNPDSLARNTRYNANGTDLNRNCGYLWSSDSEEPPGTSPWSEPENQALRNLVLQWHPAKIATLHWALGELDADGAHSKSLLETMWNSMSEHERVPYRCHLQTESSANTSLPGSFGRWCGFAVQYPDGSRPAIVTLELPYDPVLPRPERLPNDHLEQLRTRWQQDAAGYNDAVYPAVHKMLLAACSAVI